MLAFLAVVWALLVGAMIYAEIPAAEAAQTVVTLADICPI